MKKMIYPACFYPGEENEGGYTVVIPDLPGAVTEGDSLEEAFEMAIECASGWILGSIEDGEEVPKPSKIEKIKLEYKNGFKSYIILDIDEFAKLYGRKSVKKTVTLPNYLNTLAEKANINFSEILQDGIKDKLLLKK